MIDKIKVTINVIVHATEDISKIFRSFEELLDLNEGNFIIQGTAGHYNNPIIMLNAKITKKEAQNFMRKLLELLSAEQIKELVGEIEERTADSGFHMRLDKQELVRGNITFGGKETVKIEIHAPIYNKKDTLKTFTKIFQIAN